MQVAPAVQVAATGGKEKVVHARRNRLLKGPVAPNGEFQICTVASHHIDQGFGQFVAVLFVDPSLDRLEHLGIGKRIYLVPTASPRAAVRREVATVVEALERDAEVIAGGIERSGQMNHLPMFGYRILRGTIEIQAS